MYNRDLSFMLIVFLLIASSVAAQSQRITVYDFAAPYLQSRPSFVGEGNTPALHQETIIALELEIDANGKVSNISMDTSAHERLAKYIDPFLRQLKFNPALFQEQKVSSRLPIEVLLWPGKQWPVFTFPMDTLGQVNNRRLYDRCLELNDITQPRVTRFESYYATPNMDTALVSYRFVLFAVDLDSTGAVLDRRILISTYPVYDEQVLTAILWGEFAPASVKGRTIPSTLYLMVSFFGAVAYPSPIWPPNPDSISNPLEFFRIRSFTDQSGLMALPMPVRLYSDLYPLGPERVFRHNTVSVQVRIDTLGRCRFGSTDRTFKELLGVLRKTVNKIKFFPALDFNGRPQNYSGLVYLEFTDKTTVRVRCSWLH